MKKNYRFIKDYTTMITVGGVVGMMPKSFKKGDIVQGTPIQVSGGNGFVTTGVKIELSTPPYNNGLWADISSMIGAQTTLDVPIENLELYSGEKESKSNKVLIPAILSISVIAIGIFLICK